MRGRRRITGGFAMLALAGALALPGGAAARATGVASSTAAATHPVAAATLEGCVTSGPQVERSATFTGEMTALPGTSRMLMRIDVQERGPADESFRTIAFPGLGVWLKAAAGVHTFKNLQRVTDLAGSADYRAQIRFRWLGAHGRQLRAQLMRTPRCVQPATPVLHDGTGTTAGSGTASAG